MTSRDKSELILIRGVVVPLKWDLQGNVIAVGISGFGEIEYAVAPPGDVDHWVGLLRKEIHAEGRVVGAFQGISVLNIERCISIGGTVT